MSRVTRQRHRYAGSSELRAGSTRNGNGTVTWVYGSGARIASVFFRSDRYVQGEWGDSAGPTHRGTYSVTQTEIAIPDAPEASMIGLCG